MKRINFLKTLLGIAVAPIVIPKVIATEPEPETIIPIEPSEEQKELEYQLPSPQPPIYYIIKRPDGSIENFKSVGLHYTLPEGQIYRIYEWMHGKKTILWDRKRNYNKTRTVWYDMDLAEAFKRGLRR